jgi:hypothetical protein
VVFAVKLVTLKDKTLPTFRPLNPVKNVAKVLLVDTSKRYPDNPPPVLAAQLAVKLLEVRLVVERVPGVDGAAANVKVLELVAVPPAVVTATVPVEALPSTTTSEVPEFEVIDETAVPPTVTFEALTPDKFVPVIVKVVPGQPVVGVIDEIVGGIGGAEIENVPGQGLLGVGQVSNHIKYCTPEVIFTVNDLDAADDPTEFIQVPPEAGQAPE